MIEYRNSRGDLRPLPETQQIEISVWQSSIVQLYLMFAKKTRKSFHFILLLLFFLLRVYFANTTAAIIAITITSLSLYKYVKSINN